MTGDRLDGYAGNGVSVVSRVYSTALVPDNETAAYRSILRGIRAGTPTGTENKQHRTLRSWSEKRTFGGVGWLISWVSPLQTMQSNLRMVLQPSLGFLCSNCLKDRAERGSESDQAETKDETEETN